MESYNSYNKIWSVLQNIFPIIDDTRPLSQFDEKPNFENVQIFQSLNLSDVQNLIISKIEERIRKQVAPEFWSCFSKYDQDEYRGFTLFYDAVKNLYDRYKQLESTIVQLELFKQATQFNDLVYNETTLPNALKLIFKATLLSQLFVGYQAVVLNFYEIALKLEDNDDKNDETNCFVCLKDRGECNCLRLFHETNWKLGNIGLLEPLVGQAITNLIYNHINSHISKTCMGNYNSSFISSLEQWVQSVVLKWLRQIYRFDSNSPIEEAIEKFNLKLTSYMYNSYTKNRIDQLFTIIIDYPESIPAVEDLRICLPRTDLKPVLIRKLQKSIESRLLHQGVSTPDILSAYIAAVRSLRVLDPTGLLLETVTQPVHQYLRSRNDTVRCVVSGLTEDGPNEFAEELIRGDAVQLDDSTPVDEDEENWETWVPDPVDAIPNKPVQTRRTTDIISMLVNVYGSKDLFVSEYRNLLADRLLSHYFCDTEKEIRYLELLKLRFGDSQLHYCEVMLKDVADSKRINHRIRQDPEYSEEGIPISAMIVSAQYWPPFKEEKLQVHNRLEQQMESYTNAFETLKGSRTLCWKHHLGVVELEIELGDRTLNFSVSPVLATIMMYFQDKGTWDLEELGKLMQCPATFLKGKISFWQCHGILVETSPYVFQIKEDLDDKDNNVPEDIFVEDYEAESAMASAQDQREEELQTFWSYIVGMLMNLDTLPLERIHQMLKMFAFQGPTIECSLPELKVFLDRKVREHQLIYANGLYKLPK